MTTPTTESIKKGQAIYTPLNLRIYNLFVLGFSNRFVWRCDTNTLLKFYNKHVSANHLDVGVGTGYFLDHCKFPDAHPQVALLDLNESCLRYTANLIKRYHPKTYQADIYQPLNMVKQKFDSIGLNYVLHCLPGDFEQKSAAIGNLKQLLNTNGMLFGSTILTKDQKHNFLGNKLVKIYNAKGIFGNLQDDRQNLEKMLKQHFQHVDIKIVGTVALFTARD